MLSLLSTATTAEYYVDSSRGNLAKPLARVVR